MIETERLEIVPLTLRLLRACNTLNPGKGLSGLSAEFSEDSPFKVLKEQVEEDYEMNHWHGLWLLIRKTDRIVVGSIELINLQNSNGEVEIGCALEKKYEHNGYMTEAVKEMCHWTLQQKGIKKLIAETALNNIASQKILIRCGFIRYKEDKTIWWEL